MALENIQLIETDSGIMSVEEASERFQVPEIIARYGVWCVTSAGIDCLQTLYQIDKILLLTEDWIFHMGQKNWVNMFDFTRCYLAALKYHYPEKEAA